MTTIHIDASCVREQILENAAILYPNKRAMKIALFRFLCEDPAVPASWAAYLINIVPTQAVEYVTLGIACKTIPQAYHSLLENVAVTLGYKYRESQWSLSYV